MSRAVAGKHAPRRRAWFALPVMLLGLLFTFELGVSPAQAHAELLSTTPEDGAALEAAPDTVELRFNEPVQLVEGATRLFPGDGTPVVLEARAIDTVVSIALPDDLGEGAYALAYRVVSADGHPVGGAIAFQIGDGTYATPKSNATPADPLVSDAIVSALTFAQYLGLLVFAGLVFFEQVVLRTAGAPDSRTRRLLRYSFGTTLLASLLLIPASGSRVTGNEFITYLPERGDLVILPPEAWLSGVSWQLVAVVALIGLFGVAALVFISHAGSKLMRVSASACATGALATPMLIGHTQTVQPTGVMLVADLGHLVAGAFWAGGVIGLLVVLLSARPGSRGDPSHLSPEHAVGVVERFSRFALYSVLLLAVSGTVMAALIVGSWGGLFTTGYGRLLIGKLAVVAVIIVLAAWNRLRLLPRIARRPSDAARWAALRRTLGAEAALLVAVLAVTGFLTNSSPTRDHAHQHAQTSPTGGEAAIRVESQGLTVDGTLIPGTRGSNTLSFSLEYAGEPLGADDVDSISVEARLPEQELGPFTATPTFDPSTAHYETDLTLPVAGEWQVQVLVRIDTYAQPIAAVPVTIP